jgi:FtsH-binding integral membrane protein
MISYLVIVLVLFEDSDLLYLMISCLGIFFALAIVAFDTQIIIRTKRFGITQDDHIVAALLMYIDPILAIVHVLKIVFKC